MNHNPPFQSGIHALKHLKQWLYQPGKYVNQMRLSLYIKTVIVTKRKRNCSLTNFNVILNDTSHKFIAINFAVIWGHFKLKMYKNYKAPLFAGLRKQVVRQADSLPSESKKHAAMKPCPSCMCTSKLWQRKLKKTPAELKEEKCKNLTKFCFNVHILNFPETIELLKW